MKDREGHFKEIYLKNYETRLYKFIFDLFVLVYAYVKAGEYSDSLPTIELYTYCAPIGASSVAVEYTLEGKVLPSQTGSIPYKCVINSDSISVGVHDLKVTVKSGGYTEIKQYSMDKNETEMITIKEK